MAPFTLAEETRQRPEDMDAEIILAPALKTEGRPQNLELQIVFTPVGAYQAVIEITDELGCDEPSYGQVLAAEKHGYTRPVEIPWP